MEILEKTKTKNGLFKFLGITLFIQAVTAFIGGSIFLGPFDSNEITDATMRTIANSTGTAYISIFLQVITAVVIIMLGIAMYRAAGHINKVMADIALSMYVFEAILLAVGQVFVFGLTEASKLYLISADSSLLVIGKIMLSCREFAGQIAMIPFGIGAILFYYIIMKAQVIPKWLGLYGLITVPFILISVPFMAFGIDIPFVFLVPYVPFEFFTGIYILIKYRKKGIE